MTLIKINFIIISELIYTYLTVKQAM